MTAEAPIGKAPDQSPLGSLEAYRNTLKSAGLSEIEINAKANAYASTHPLVTPVVELENVPTQTPIKLSRRASACVQAARDAGIDETEIGKFIENAMATAASEHKRKVGLFGKAGSVMRRLSSATTIARANAGYEGPTIVNEPR